MYLLGIVLLLISLIPDVSYQFSIGDTVFKTQFAGLFLFYIVFRKDLKYILTILFIYVVVISAFTGLGFTQIFLSYFIVLGIFYKLRTEIYLESYFIQPLWVFLMLWAQLILIQILEFKGFMWSEIPEIILSGLFNSLFMAAFVLPVFYIWDHIYQLFRTSSHEDSDFSGQAILKGKKQSKNLL